ncbi:2-5A-dependent ribonuclease [Gracilinanus agilis]|uniref:2-5A-dependent ribonuclease n=1 Tax=Gracilinanus agilis TaxID=191870 RepID=UPI001CFEF4AD|nr:2-5A-dependent ribonuclease [Gracilinanus agilis]
MDFLFCLAFFLLLFLIFPPKRGKENSKIQHCHPTSTFMAASNSKSHEKSTAPFTPKEGCPPLIQAVQKGDRGLVLQLLEEGADINVRAKGGWTPLHNAVKEGKEEIVQLLLDKGADPHIRKDNGATPFIVAGIMGDVKLLRLFLSKGADVNEHDIHGFTAFMEAACYGKVEALEFLYKNGANVNLGRQTSEEQKKLGKGGTTALMDAAQNGHVDALKILLEKMGADVNVCDNMGRNALFHSLLNPKIENVKCIVSILLAHGADVNVRGEKGKTPLILAVEKEDDELVKMLLKQDGIDINETDSDGNTALLLAVEKNHFDIAKLLCESGAKADCEELINIAERKYNPKMKRLLQDYGAHENFCCPDESWEPNSQRWKVPLKKLHEMYRPMIGRLKIFIDKEYKIAETSEGGVYLGFYDGKEVAVKRFREYSKRAEQEIACIQQCQKNSNLVMFHGRESDKGCLYLCFSLCENTLKEHLAGQREAALMDEDFTKNILMSLFKAVQELHGSHYAHQDLHPENILIDSTGKVCLADFDKSEKLDEAQQKIKDDLKALGRLVLYVVRMGNVPFVEIQTQSDDEVIDDCPNDEIEDLVKSLLCPGEEFQSQLSEIVFHPFFWSCKTRFRFLRDVGNESDIKVREKDSKLLRELNSTNKFQNWTAAIDKSVMTKMNSFYKEERLFYKNTVGDLLKFIRNIGEHIEERKNKWMKSKIGEPSKYFQKTFPDLVIYVYQILQAINYRKHFPRADSSLPG